MDPKLKALYGLKFNPFAAELPLEALYVTPQLEDFIWRLEHGLAVDGGFALVTGEAGTGKSVALRLLADRLARHREVSVGCLEHPQSNLADFYRELGDLFGVPLRPHNRWAGFRDLRQKWLAHLESTLRRPLLLVDEAQEMSAATLSELRILAASRFDSRNLLGVVLAGDDRLLRLLQREELLPLGSRLRARLRREPATAQQLRACLDHLLAAAGNAKLFGSELAATLCDHALGNYRVLVTMANDLLSAAVQRDINVLDEKLYLEVFTVPATEKTARQSRGGRR